MQPANHRTFVAGVAVLAVCLALVAVRPGAAGEQSALWAALRSGEAIALMRHALAPGTGDPASFDIADCTTQRNLSDIGRAQAGRIGERFRENGVLGPVVYSSAWCRCLETAELLGFGDVSRLPALNSFYTARQRETAQTTALIEWLKSRQKDSPAILVTHQVNITALTGVYPTSGEFVVARLGTDGKVQVLGSIRPQADAITSRCDCGEDQQ